MNQPVSTPMQTSKLLAAAAPDIARDIAGIRIHVARWRAAGETIALVPTMGALHDGHLSLVDLARKHAQRVIVTIFVNPAQFAPTEDFEKYPRTFAADAALLASAQVDAIFAPDVATIYPEGFATGLTIAGPAKAGLEDAFRPGHFDGVATVVAKLHTICAPDFAIYGEKDFQQLAVIQQMNADLNLPVEVIGAPTVRAPDGLAMSSRNAYLSKEERAKAPLLHTILCACRDQICADGNVEDILKHGLFQLREAGFLPDYLDLRDAQTLGPPAIGTGRQARLLTAARLGATRLIDNIAVTAS